MTHSLQPPPKRAPASSSYFRTFIPHHFPTARNLYSVLGQPKLSLQQGVNETLTWLRTQPGFTDLPPGT